MNPTEKSVRDKTYHSQETDVHVPAGIRVHSPRERAVADPDLRPRGYRDRPEVLQYGKTPCFSEKYLWNLYLGKKKSERFRGVAFCGHFLIQSFNRFLPRVV